MKTKFLTFIAALALTAVSFAQAPGSVKYQAVLRDASNLVLNNTTVDMQFTIFDSGMNSVWTNTYNVTSNDYGLVNIDLGPGLDAIAWGTDSYTMETAVDFLTGGGMVVMGSSPLLSVPYAMHSTTADSAINDNVDDADADPANEHNTGLALNATSIEITDAGGTLSQDLDGTFTTDAELAAAGYLTAELDGDPTNEIQTIVSADANNSIIAGTDGGAYYDASGAGGSDTDWTISGTDMYSGVTGNVGIGTTSPDNKLDVNGKISVTQSPGDEMVIINDDIWAHGSGDQDFGDGGDHFLVGSREGAFESAGIYGDGDHVTIWSPGDAATGQTAAYIYVNDEDSYNGGTDSDPFNNNALQAYLNTAGNWVAASDKNRKESIVPLESSLEKILMINGYAYKFKLVQEEIEKGDVAPVTYGVIAQEVREVLPELVDVNADGSHFVSYTEFIPVLIEATKEQQKIIEAQKAENESLKLKMLELERRLDALEQK